MAADLPVGRIARLFAVLPAYALSGAVVWAPVGLLVNVVSLRPIGLIVTVIYGVCYGLPEAMGKTLLRSPGTAWQVPDSFVRNRPRAWRVIVWASLLGPGFVTRNPYSGFGVLPIALASVGSAKVGIVLGTAVGIAHGGGRGAALLRSANTIAVDDYLDSVLRSLRWRVADGFILLVLAAIAAAVCILQF